jgi:hypothetical protein
MNKDNCKVNQNVAYFANKKSDTAEFGVITELRPLWAMVLYEGENISKATNYADLEAVPETLTLIGKEIN